MISGAMAGSNSGLPSASLPSSGSYWSFMAARNASSDAGGDSADCHAPVTAFAARQRPTAHR